MMVSSGIGLLIVLLGMGLVIVLALVLAVMGLLSLRRRPMDEVPRFLWVLFITLLPLLGAIVYFMVHPGSLDRVERESV